MIYDKENIIVSADGMTYTGSVSGNGALCPAVYISEALFSVSQNNCTSFGSCIKGTCRSGDFSVTTDDEGKPVFIWLDAVKMQFDLKDIKIT